MSSMFVINEESKLRYASIYILKEMQEKTYEFKVQLDDDEEVLAPILEWLVERRYIFETDNQEYAITTVGASFLWSFLDRYHKFLTDCDVFCGVDLTNGDFAFKYFDRYPAIEDWYQFLDDERWDDLRIAVAEYLGLDALEIVFMSFINDRRFGRDESGWSQEMLTGAVWDEIQLICNNAIRLKSLAQEHEGRTIPAESVMAGVFQSGRSVMDHMRRQAANVVRY